MTGRIGVLLLVIVCCLLFAQQARATDYAYGYTSIDVDSGGLVRGYHRTEVDYNTDVYYRPYLCASLFKDGVEVVRACQGGFASATRNTQTAYVAGSTYSALSDHYVNIEYEEEDPYNPGYYYYSDYLGYYFSGGGSQPIDWYYIASGIYNMRPDESLHLGDTNAVVDPNRRILSITQQIIDESSQGSEVVECGRFRIITRYQVGCPPPAHILNLTGHIEEDATLQSSATQLIQNQGDELCTYEITNLYKMKNRLDQTIGTGFTRYTARLTYRDITVGKTGPGISTRATIPGVGTCP